MRFTAVQRYAVDRVAFSWQARFPILGPIGIRVVDAYADGEGTLEARVLGIPLQRQAGPETATGEALRYLAELPWVPHAMAYNRELEWRGLGERSVEVATRVGGERLAARLDFDAGGDVVRASSDMRLRPVGSGWSPTPWGGDFGEYQVLFGVRLPTRAEVHWELEGGRFTYWSGRVTAAELLPERFGEGGACG